MLRRLAGAVSAPLRRSLCTAASRPPWAMVYSRAALDHASGAPSPAPRASLDHDAAPYVSHISVPAHLARGMDFAAATVRTTSSDGLLLLDLAETRHLYPPGPPGARESLDREILLELSANGATSQLDAARFVCNPLSGQMLRLPDIGGSKTTLLFHHMGLLTQADGGARGQGPPPDRFAVADLVHNGAALERFLSDEGEWRTVMMSRPCRSRLLRPMAVNQETVAFGGRLWWVDSTLGAMSVDPFDERPDICCIELPRGSVLPARAPSESGDFRKAEENVKFMQEVAKYRRVGVSEGRLRYAELTPGGPFLLSSFALDDEGSGWTLENQLELKEVLANGGYPLQRNAAAPQIAVLDPLDASAVHLKVGDHVVVVDMHNGKVIKASQLQDKYLSLIPCVLPPWLLGASRIPTAGKKDDMEATDDQVICL